MSSRAPRLRRFAAAAATVALGAGAAFTPAAQAEAGSAATPAVSGDPTRTTAAGVYVVTLASRPAATHPSTRPEPGQRFDRTRAVVRERVRNERSEQDRLLHTVGDPELLYRYTTALNGFAVRLDESQVKRLRAAPEVALVERSTTRRTAASRPGTRGAADLRSAWSEPGGPAGAGRGTVIGFVDTGIWPENPSFAGLPQQEPGTSTALDGFHGACASAEQWTPRDCNDKVVSARWFVRGFGEDRVSSTEILSPRDSLGHGSHTASTAAGARQVGVQIDGQQFGRDSGMAPAARIAVYKACWTAPDPREDGCTTADVVAAIDRAVADGVDVLNYSVAGSDDPTDTVSRAFLSATTAGVFVAAAAGNDGPADASVGNVAPWVTTVAASTQGRYQGGVRLGDGTTLVGAMTSDDTVTTRRLVLARDAAAQGATDTAAALCDRNALDSDAVAGAIVVCDRGLIPRVDKSAAVAQAGGVGMILVNTEPDTVEADIHAVPTVHLDSVKAATVKAYLRDAGQDARATLLPDLAERGDVPAIAPFSARGPVPGGDLLKPDVTAPGVSVLGAVAPPSSSGRLWDLYSGTSVSAPHVAGLAAFLHGQQPTWSPARIKSALMTTAADLEGTAGPFAAGAGQVRPSSIFDPGLVLDVRPAQWRAYLEGRATPQSLNVPSIAVGRLVGRATVTRRITNVAATTETFAATVSGLEGIDTTVMPRTVTLDPGQSRRIRVRFAATNAARVDDFARGQLTWTGLSHQVRLPVVVRTARVAAPREVATSIGDNELVISGRTGTGGPVELESTGLVPANPVGLTLQPGAMDSAPGGASPEVDEDTFATDVEVPADTAAARFELESVNPGDDVDLYVYRDGVLVGSATGPSPDATLSLVRPAAGEYTVYVHAVSAGNGSTTTSELSTWVIGENGGDEITLETEQEGSAPGDEFRYRASWEGLDPTRRWLGVVRYQGSDRVTFLRVD